MDCCARSPVQEALLKQVLPAVITDDGTRAPATVTGADDRRHGIRPDDPSDAPPDAADDAAYTPPDAADDAAYTPPDAAEDIS